MIQLSIHFTLPVNAASTHLDAVTKRDLNKISNVVGSSPKKATRSCTHSGNYEQ